MGKEYATTFSGCLPLGWGNNDEYFIIYLYFLKFENIIYVIVHK